MVFKNKETSIDSKDALSLTTFLTGCGVGFVIGVILCVFVVIVR